MHFRLFKLKYMAYINKRGIISKGKIILKNIKNK